MLVHLLRAAGRRASQAAVLSRLAVPAARSFATDAAPKPSGGGGRGLALLLGTLGLGGGLYYAHQQGMLDGVFGAPPAQKEAVKRDYGAVRKAIADLLEADEYDDGSFGPILVRLAWHSSGSYDKATNSGGSNGATMRFSPESDYEANAGLKVARDLLEPVKAKFPWLTYADLYTLGGVVAVEEMGGPTIPWKEGRSDMDSGNACGPDGRLPDASLDQKHLRDIFYRMGFNDQEIVALSGAHALGRCHADRSGYVNPWTFAPTTFSNQYFTLLRDEKWSKKKWKGPLQYEDSSKQLMMLPTDMALIWDKKFKPYVMEYASDEEKFFKDFAAAFSKLLENGVPRTQGEAPAAASPAPAA
ncbi:hypothetical protein WJX81_000152 [Elliptochloris bilobata]|uniref:Cytochrome c peroxidase, mitochondrial n=1 Tax=Elliptochloris bilobata TaxID=381761 RepID=A0AAW1SBF9_9CHLO